MTLQQELPNSKTPSKVTAANFLQVFTWLCLHAIHHLVWHIGTYQGWVRKRTIWKKDIGIRLWHLEDH